MLQLAFYDFAEPMLTVFRQQYQSTNRDVSPIYESPDVSRLELNQTNPRPAASHIPVPRKQRVTSDTIERKAMSARPNARNVVNPRWDPYSGEITTGDRGKPQSVKPKEFAGVILRPTGLSMGNTSNVTGGTKTHTSFSDRIRKLKNKNEIPAERPEWKGATGRVKLVAPVADRHDLPPLSVPRRNVSHVASPQSDTYSGPPTPNTVIRSNEAETVSVSSSTERMYEDEEGTPSRIYTPIEESSVAIVSPSIIAKSFRASPTIRSPVETSPTFIHRSDSTGTIERNFRVALNDVSTSDEAVNPYVQPASRFSQTTYAPSEAQTTPRPSTSDTWERPAMPSPPRRMEADNTSVLNRKRPQIGPGESMKPSISRKAINPGAPLYISMSSSVASRRSSSTSMLKGLPITPAEAQSHDLVTSLQAQLDALQLRKRNIERGIRQMTELMPKDHIVLTEEVRRKREGEKVKVEGLRREEADVRREEHDVGLRLHRAWKRRDKDAVYEPTALWVRRVT